MDAGCITVVEEPAQEVNDNNRNISGQTRRKRHKELDIKEDTLNIDTIKDEFESLTLCQQSRNDHNRGCPNHKHCHDKFINIANSVKDFRRELWDDQRTDRIDSKASVNYRKIKLFKLLYLSREYVQTGNTTVLRVSLCICGYDLYI
jgi:hypothetical protein